MNRALHGSCHVPVAALARIEGEALVLQGLVGSAANGRAVRAQARASLAEGDALGRRVAGELLSSGADALLAAQVEPDSGPFDA